MIDDEWIDGERIRERLRITGRTQRQLAEAMGIDASGISRLLDGTRILREDEMTRIRAFFDPSATSPPRPPSQYRLGLSNEDARGRRQRPGPPRSRATGDIPVYAANAGVTIYGGPVRRGEPFFDLDATAVERRRRPEQLLGVEGAFAVFAPGDALSPRYRSGETLLIHPTKPPSIGHDVFIRRRSDRFVALLRYLGGDGNALRFSSASSVYPCSAVPDDDLMIFRREALSQIGRLVAIAAN